MWEIDARKYCVTIINAQDVDILSISWLQAHLRLSVQSSLLVSVSKLKPVSLGTANWEHALLYRFGVRQFIVGTNKIDSNKSPYSQKWYEKIIKVASAYIKKIDYKLDVVTFGQISGFNSGSMLELSSRDRKSPIKMMVPVKPHWWKFWILSHTLSNKCFWLHTQGGCKVGGI